MSEEISAAIFENVRKHFHANRQEFVRGKTRISLQDPPIGADEVNEAIESLLSTWLTMGRKVKKFEEEFASYLGSKYAIMVNSGSSANLLTLSVLTNSSFHDNIPVNSEVITPAVTWVTTVYPIVNTGLTPVLVDVDLDTLCIDTNSIEQAISSKTKAIMPVHLLGNPSEMDAIMDIARKYDLYVIEDSCEAHGAEVDSKKVGTIGDVGTFSFFMSHHITTIEGGMIVTDNEELYETAKAMRAFGWIRDLKNKDTIERKHPDLDPRFLFINMGYNFRPTEIQGAFGIHQIKKLNKFVGMRQENANYWNSRLEKYDEYFVIHRQRPNTRHTWFAYPITIKPGAPFKKSQLMAFLEKNLIDTRPIEASDITEQPVIDMFPHRVSGRLLNSKIVHNNSFFIGNHQGIGAEQREYIADVIDDFIRTVGK